MRLPLERARECFAAARVARLATVDASGQPHVVPITFAVDGQNLVFAVDRKPKSTTRLRRLHNIAENPLVSVLADGYSEDWNSLWWARADGTAAVVSGEDVHAHYIGLLTAKYPQYAADPPLGPVVRIEVTQWSGWSAAGSGAAGCR